jgi:hypothetical protein
MKNRFKNPLSGSRKSLTILAQNGHKDLVGVPSKQMRRGTMVLAQCGHSIRSIDFLAVGLEWGEKDEFMVIASCQGVGGRH